jgi:hypothetical protein
MTSKSLFCVAILVFCVAASQPTHAQTTPDSKPNPELNRKAQSLLADTVTLTHRLKNKENQILSRIALAELQWNDQQKSARQLYQEAFELVQKAWANLDPDDNEAPYSENIIRLRDRLIESVAHRDAAISRQMFEQSRLAGRSDKTAGMESNSGVDQSELAGYDNALETRIAAAAAEDNSDEMAGVIRKELDSGSFRTAVFMLRKLAEKDSEKAGTLMGDVVDKLRKVDYETDYSAIEVFYELMGQAFSAQPKHKKETEQLGLTGRIPMSPELSRQVVEIVADAALNAKSTRSQTVLLIGLRDVIEDISEIAPAQGERLKKRFAELDKPATGEASPYEEMQKLVAKHDLATMLEAARTAPPEMRDIFYRQAAQAAWEQGDRAQAKEIVEKNVRSAFERNRLLRDFRDETIADSIKNSDLVQAHQLIQQTRSLESRLSQLINLAAAYVLKSDKKAAAEILAEAQSLMPAKPLNRTQLELEIRLANALAAVDLDRSFALMGAAIDQINELSNAAARVAAFMGVMPSLKDGEFELESFSSVTGGQIPGVREVLSKESHPLIEADFERTRKMFDRFERPEFRISAYLFLARRVLQPEDDCSCSCPESAADPAKTAPKN